MSSFCISGVLAPDRNWLKETKRTGKARGNTWLGPDTELSWRLAWSKIGPVKSKAWLRVFFFEYYISEREVKGGKEIIIRMANISLKLSRINL